MKSNYMKSAEIKIAKNPECSEWYKRMLIADAMQKEFNLKRMLGLLNTVYIPEHECTPSRGYRAQIYFHDDWAHDLSAYEPTSIYTTATELTRENLERLIDNVRAASAQEPIFIGTRNGLDAYRIRQTTTTAWEPYRNDAIAQIRFED